MKEKIVLIGGGGHCKSVISSIKAIDCFEIVGITDVESKVGATILDIKVIGTDNILKEVYDSGVKSAFITLGSIGDVTLRKKLYLVAKEVGFKFPNIIDKTAIVSEECDIKEGTFIGKGAIINADAYIGSNCIINTGAIIDHDCYIGDFVHIGPGSTLSGSVEVMDNSHLGTNSTVIQNIKIGHDSIIGAGSVVVKNIRNGQCAFGNPCREVVK